MFLCLGLDNCLQLCRIDYCATPNAVPINYYLHNDDKLHSTVGLFTVWPGNEISWHIVFVFHVTPAIPIQDAWSSILELEFGAHKFKQLSRLPQKSGPLHVRTALGIAGLPAIIDPLLIFHLFCLVFPHTWFQFPQLLVVYLTICSPHVFVWDCLL